MDTKELLELQSRYVLPTYDPRIILNMGRGCYVWDVDGNEYLDFTTGITVCSLGHCHPAVTTAIQQQAARLVHVSNLFMNDQQPQLAALIAEKSLGGRVFFCNSGAEANEGLIKFARKWGSSRGKYQIIYMSNSFHGRTLATLAATDRPQYREGFGPDVEGFIRVPFNDLAALEAAITERTAAIIMEPVQGEGGVRPATAEFIAGARSLCDRYEVLLLFDEVQTGMGRTGHYFAYQHYQVTPDGMSLAKALGNGFPIGAFVIRRQWDQVMIKGSHASTFGGTALACAASLAVFHAIDRENVLSNCQESGRYFIQELNQMAGEYTCIKEVRGIGLMVGVEFNTAVAPILKAAADAGLLLIAAGENIIRLYPPLTVTPAEIDQAISILKKVCPK